MATTSPIARWRLARRRRRLARGKGPARPKAALALFAALAVLTGAVVWSFAYLEPYGEGRELRLDQLLKLAEEKRVAGVVLLDEDGRLAGRNRGSEAVFWTAYPKGDPTLARLVEALGESGATIRVDSQTAKAAVRTILTVLLPLMILANLFALFFVSAKGGGSSLGEVVSFGRLGRRRRGTRPQSTTFADVAGIDEAVEELTEVVDYLRNPARYEALGATPPKGVLLFGPPGCGKTLLARAVAGEAGVPFIAVAGAEFVESLVGVGAARVRDLFARVRAVAPAIVFIDELDAAGRRRGSAGSGGGSDERDQTLNQLLVEMDGFDASSGLVVMAATNRPDILDPALLRPGRFDRHVTIERPDVERREAILRLHASRKPVSADVDFAELARRTPGFSGADLAAVVNEAALLTIRRGSGQLDSHAFSGAVRRVSDGPQTRGRILDPDTERRIAFQQSGWALVMAATGRADQVHRLSVLGRANGPALVDRREERALLSRADVDARLMAATASRAAEELWCEGPSTGTEVDLAEATSLARDVVGRWGMSAAVGPRRLVVDDTETHDASRESLEPLSAEVHAAYDAEVRRVLEQSIGAAKSLLRERAGDVERLAGRLVRDESVEGADLRALLLPRRIRRAPANGRRRTPAAAARDR